ncbi:unnamed protein product [Linum tenue]|uniref:Retrotransposon gag domain-containing protein n=1 Tax=Linum tenue TaxID=586396 RepID=A0AAV0HXC9_9ROSI|nr:unnamed protein product [Linum tenue]
MEPPLLLHVSFPTALPDLWYKRDQLVLSWIVMSLTDVVLSKLVGCTSALDAWTRLAAAYGAANRHGILHLKDQFNTLNCGSDPVDRYLTRAKDVADRLAALGRPISDEDLVSRCLNGLGESYLPLCPGD